jgi:putative transposase
MFTGRLEHLRPFDHIGVHRYSLTFYTYHRRKLFLEEPPVALVRSQILRAAEEECFAVSAYCFMPDHLHLLAHGESGGADCARFRARAKHYSGYSYAKQYGVSLWQRSGYERVLGNDESTAAVAKYILENPIRAGLVKSVVDYPFLGSTAGGVG